MRSDQYPVPQSSVRMSSQEETRATHSDLSLSLSVSLIHTHTLEKKKKKEMSFFVIWGLYAIFISSGSSIYPLAF